MDKREQELMFSSSRGDHCTPRDLFDQLNTEFNFTHDLAASSSNALLPKYFHEDDSAFDHSWKDIIGFCNPPYGRGVRYWVEKAGNESKENHAVIAMLLAGRTDTVWFHKALETAHEVRFIKGRVKFVGEDHGAPFPSIIIVWDGNARNRYYKPTTYQWKILQI